VKLNDDSYSFYAEVKNLWLEILVPRIKVFVALSLSTGDKCSLALYVTKLIGQGTVKSSKVQQSVIDFLA
jgi:hypothetical protein